MKAMLITKDYLKQIKLNYEDFSYMLGTLLDIDVDSDDWGAVENKCLVVCDNINDFIQQGNNADEKKVLCVLQESFLGSANYKEQREKIVNDGLVSLIILIPTKWIPTEKWYRNNSEERSVVLFFDTEKRKSGIIK